MKIQRHKVVVTCRSESWRKQVPAFKKSLTVLRFVSSQKLLTFKIHFKTFTEKIMTSQGFSF